MLDRGLQSLYIEKARHTKHNYPNQHTECRVLGCVWLYLKKSTVRNCSVYAKLQFQMLSVANGRACDKQKAADVKGLEHWAEDLSCFFLSLHHKSSHTW